MTAQGIGIILVVTIVGSTAFWAGVIIGSRLTWKKAKMYVEKGWQLK